MRMHTRYIFSPSVIHRDLEQLEVRLVPDRLPRSVYRQRLSDSTFYSLECDHLHDPGP